MENKSQLRLIAISSSRSTLNEIKKILEGEDVIAAEDPQEALEVVEKDGIGLVLIDCEMKGRDLWRMMKEKSPRTSVILFGGDLSAEELIQVYREGVYDYVPKSRLTTDLRKTIERVEERRRLGEREEDLKRKLKESEKKYRGLIEHANDPIFTLAANGILTFVNKKMEEVTGRSKEELVGEKFSNFIPSEMREDFEESFQRIWSQGNPKEVEVEVLDKEGRRITLAVNYTPIVVDKEVVGMQCIARDITGRKESEERLRKMVEASEEGIVTFDSEGRFTSLNKQAEKVLGYRVNQLLGETLERIVLPDQGGVAQSHLRELSLADELVRVTFNISTSDGQEREVEFRTKPLERGGEVIGAISVVQQVVEEEEGSPALEILNSLKSPFLAFNERGEMTMANRAFSEATGFSPSEIEGKPISELIDQEEQEPDGKTRLSLRTKSGGSLILLAHSFPLLGRLKGRVIIGEKVIG